MSVFDWKKEFYPVDSHEATDPLEHSLTKWIGLLPENTAKHNVRVTCVGDLRNQDGSNGFMYIDGRTCALCIKFRCSDCPLGKTAKATGVGNGEDCLEQFNKWTSGGDPKPMIELIKKAIEMSEEDTLG